ncbi:MAG: Ig-like domain-containing protein [Pseudomonadota bacterium]
MPVDRTIVPLLLATLQIGCSGSNVAQGAHTQSPVVGISSPMSGATVWGVTTITAAATDDVGVASVAIQVDGTTAGGELSASPYSVSWDTSTVANGSHTITATAKDAAENTTTSDGVTVTVSNGAVVGSKIINHPYPRIGLLQWGGGNVDWFCRYNLVMVPMTETYKAREMQTRCPNTYILVTFDWDQGGVFQPPGHANVLPNPWFEKVYYDHSIPSRGDDSYWGIMNFTHHCPAYHGDITSAAYADFEIPTTIHIENKTYSEAVSDAFMDYIDWTAWDGVNSDGTWVFPYNSPDLDLDLDGVYDFTQHGCASNPCTSSSTGFEAAYLAIQQDWVAGYEALFQMVRDKMQAKLGKQKLITYWNISAGDAAHGALMGANIVNGAGWEMASYLPNTWTSFIPNNAGFASRGPQPKINWVNSTMMGDRSNAPDPTKPKNYFRFMRYMLTQTLRGDNYFMQEDGSAFPEGGRNEHMFHSYYDEFDVKLGYPTGAAQSLPSGVWVRFFDNGVSITNPTASAKSASDADLQTLTGYNGPYYRFVGNQDNTVNNGAAFGSVTLTSSASGGSVNPVGDGILLVRTSNTVVVSDIIVDNVYAGTSPGSEPAVMTSFSWDENASGNYRHPSYYVGSRTDNSAIMHKQHTAAAGSGSATAVFAPTIHVPGQYRVYEWHGWYGANSSATEGTNVPAAIVHTGGTANVTINQRENFGQWNFVGMYALDPTHASVTITNNANGRVIADAFKFVYVGP